MTLDIDMIYTKVVVVKAIYNFAVDKSFYLRTHRVPNICFKFSGFENQFLFYFQTRHTHYQNYRAR